MMNRKCKFACALLLPLFLSACAGLNNEVTNLTPQSRLQDAMAKVQAATEAGQTDKAMTLLKSTASSFPADKTPWVKMAQIKFDSANYSEAITYSLEALQRDPADNVANSIVAISGLRLCTKALSDLKGQNNLSKPLQTEAQELAKTLRESLGETVLVPGHGKSLAATRATRANRYATSRSAPVTVMKSTTTGAENRSADSNPFGSLK